MFPFEVNFNLGKVDGHLIIDGTVNITCPKEVFINFFRKNIRWI